MNRSTALLYVAAASDEHNVVDLRLAAFIAAMEQLHLSYDKVDMSAWWSARCQLGMMLSDVNEVSFRAVIRKAKSGKIGQADADDFAHHDYLPTRHAVRAARRKLRLLMFGAGLTSRIEEEEETSTRDLFGEPCKKPSNHNKEHIHGPPLRESNDPKLHAPEREGDPRPRTGRPRR